MSENSVFKDILFGTVGYLFGRREGKRRGMPAPFKTKIVITMPSWSIPLVAIASGLALYFKFSVILNMIELLIVCGAFLFTWEMSRMVQRLRYRMHHILNGIDEDATAPPEEMDDGGQRYGPWMDAPKAVPGKRVNMRKANDSDSSARV